jgi:hypothetical protein
MPYGVTFNILESTDLNRARVHFQIEKDMPNCSPGGWVTCRPSFQTEDNTEYWSFRVESCYDKCINSKLLPADLWCNDLNDAMWHPNNRDKFNSFYREYWCGWKGFM